MKYLRLLLLLLVVNLNSSAWAGYYFKDGRGTHDTFLANEPDADESEPSVLGDQQEIGKFIDRLTPTVVRHYARSLLIARLKAYLDKKPRISLKRADTLLSDEVTGWLGNSVRWGVYTATALSWAYLINSVLVPISPEFLQAGLPLFVFVPVFGFLPPLMDPWVQKYRRWVDRIGGPDDVRENTALLKRVSKQTRVHYSEDEQKTASRLSEVCQRVETQLNGLSLDLDQIKNNEMKRNFLFERIAQILNIFLTCSQDLSRQSMIHDAVHLRLSVYSHLWGENPVFEILKFIVPTPEGNPEIFQEVLDMWLTSRLRQPPIEIEIELEPNS